MSQDILVVEYEPRYTERVRQALSGHVLEPVFAKDAEEALRLLENGQPKLIVVSSMLPKMNSAELIRQIRNRGGQQTPPILLTITGYNGKTPKTDAAKLGASDLLPKPYSSSEFLGKVRQMLGDEAPEMPAPWANAEIHDELKQFDAPPASAAESAAAAPRKARANPLGDIDQLLADTLSGVRLPPVKRPAEVTPPSARGTVPAKESAPLPDLEKLLEDTLSGLEKKLKQKEAAAHAAAQAAAQTVAPAPPPTPAEVPKPRMEAKWTTPVVPPVALVSTAPEPAEAPEGEGIRFGQYLLTEKIAVGGMAEVWKAKSRGVEGFQKIVAIKKILPHLSDNSDFVDMFIDEAKLAAQLNHSNIIHIYDLGKIANSYYIAMEYIDGKDLKSILRRAVEKEQPLPIELALFVGSKIAAALDYAHRKRDFDEKELDLVHRDVSPQNVLISHEGDIKLCDFGIAKAASKASHTLAGALKGKLQYMSPEQAWGRKIDRRSDVFALGIVLFELLTGRKLFVGDNELSILEQVRQGRVIAPSIVNEEVSPQIDAIVLKALQREPENRYQTAGELARELDAIVYNFWPTPTSADLAIYMHHLYSEDAAGPESAGEPEAAATVEMESFAPATVSPPPVDSAGMAELPEPPPQPERGAEPAIVAPAVALRAPISLGTVEEPKKRFPLAAIIAGVVVLAGIAAGGYFGFKGKGATPAKDPAAAAGVIPRPTASAASVPAQPGFAGGVPTPAAQTSTVAAAGVDDARINEEVQRRLEAERLRLEAQRARQVGAGQAATPQLPQQRATTSRTAAPVVEVPEPQPVATPVPTPVSTPIVVEATPQPVPQQQPAATGRPAIKEGELVPADTEGLVPAAVIKQYKPPYPPMAKLQKVQGVVVVQALISETGKVLEVKILRGVPQNVGINEAALDAVRRSTFRPATVDGVRVKSYKNLTVPFKL